MTDLNPPVRADLLAALDTELSFLPMDSIGENGSLNLARTRPIAEVRNGYSYFEDGDVAFAKVTPCFENGKGALMQGLEKGAGFGTTEITVLRPKTGTNARYLRYIVQSEMFRQLGVGAMTGAGGLKRVPDDFTRDFKTVWPEAVAQERIANFLDDKTARIDALIAEKERLLALLNEHRLSVSAQVLAEASSGLRAKLGFCVDLLPGYAFPSDEFSRDAGNIPLLRGINVAPASIRWDETVYWSREYDSSLERFRLQQGDVVLGMDRPWISSGARVAMIDEASAGSFLLQRVCRLRGGVRLTQRFLFFALLSDEFRQSVEVDLTGVSVPHLSPEQILRFKVPVLTVDEQRVRCDVADRQLLKIEQLEAHTLQMLDRLREYRSSLISAAVTGQLDFDALEVAA
ncbi:restriction endonuclease subunit S domain-containing protein [Polaromonas naphthalenivorans]|uniref:restriction endonuclease subunit S n=1 Tax=Polaromonas naphthalenivorans TaxID=216465 RepID=UPI0012ED2124|nr:restriction endonuclease subunit S [Polaromonas naphthalenivorans]